MCAPDSGKVEDIEQVLKCIVFYSIVLYCIVFVYNAGSVLYCIVLHSILGFWYASIYLGLCILLCSS